MSFDDEFQQLVDREFDELVQEVQREADEEEEAAAFVRPFYHRQTIHRDHVGVDQRLMEDYLAITTVTQQRFSVADSECRNGYSSV